MNGPRTPPGQWPEHSVKAKKIDARLKRQCGEPFEEFHWIDQQISRPERAYRGSSGRVKTFDEKGVYSIEMSKGPSEK